MRITSYILLNFDEDKYYQRRKDLKMLNDEVDQEDLAQKLK